MMATELPELTPELTMVRAMEIGSASPAQLARHAVWEFIMNDEGALGETCVHPVTTLPVDDLAHRVVVANVSLACGERRLAMLGNICLWDPLYTEVYLAVSLQLRVRDKRWFHLARYFDADYSRKGPEQLCAHLGLTPKQVFPMRYDISHVARGHPKVAKGLIRAEPRRFLTEEARRELSDLVAMRRRSSGDAVRDSLSQSESGESGSGGLDTRMSPR